MPAGLYVPVYQGFVDHRKTVRAAALLQADQFAVAMHIVVLWHWALTNADEDGSVEGSTAAEIAMAARWTGPAAEFEEALVLVGYLDRVAGGHVIHGWDETGGKVVRKAKLERDRSRDRRAGEKAASEAERPTGRPRTRPPRTGGQAEGRSAGPTSGQPPVSTPADHMEIREDLKKDTSVGSAARSKCPSDDGEKKRATGSAARRLLDLAVSSCLEYRGIRPMVKGAADMKAMQALLSGRSEDEAGWIVREFYRQPPDWNIQQGTLDPVHIPAAATKILARRNQAGSAGACPGRSPELDDTDRLIREELAHRDDPRWPVYEREVISHKTPVGWDAWVARREAQ